MSKVPDGTPTQTSPWPWHREQVARWRDRLVGWAYDLQGEPKRNVFTKRRTRLFGPLGCEGDYGVVTNVCAVAEAQPGGSSFQIAPVSNVDRFRAVLLSGIGVFSLGWSAEAEVTAAVPTVFGNGVALAFFSHLRVAAETRVVVATVAAAYAFSVAVQVSSSRPRRCARSERP